jgi:phosphoenolpyruvate carboxykinase (GTP)
VLLSVDDGTWLQEARSIHEHLTSLGDHVPARLWDEYHALLDRLLDRAP